MNIPKVFLQPIVVILAVASAACTACAPKEEPYDELDPTEEAVEEMGEEAEEGMEEMGEDYEYGTGEAAVDVDEDQMPMDDGESGSGGGPIRGGSGGGGKEKGDTPPPTP